MRRLVCIMALCAVAFSGCGDDDDDVDVPAAIDDDEDATVGDFDTLDANGDSYLDVDEITEAADVDGIFDTWDADADSELDRDEIAGNAFSLWDIDGDGTVDESEWRTATELWYPTDQRPTVFSDWDNDGDSELDADEVAESLDLSVLGESWADPLDKDTFKRAYFELYDDDGNGQVTEAEWNRGKARFGSPNE